MKVDDYDPSPQEAALIAKVLGVTPRPGSTEKILKKKPSASRPVEARKQEPSVENIAKAVDQMIAYQKKFKNKTFSSAERQTEIKAIRKGEFNAAYWSTCVLSEEKTFQCVPSSSAYTGPRNYGYVDPLYQPTLSDYGAGTETAGNARTEGATVDDVYTDTLYAWRRLKFTLPRKFPKAAKDPLFLNISGTITASANVQAARALISLVAKAYVVPAASATMSTTAAPTADAISWWYPYQTPRGSAPYWHYALDFVRQVDIRNQKYEEHATDNDRAVVVLGPAPLRGYRFNNNDNVSSEVSFVATLHCIKKAIGGFILYNLALLLDGTTKTISGLVSNQYAYFDADHGVAITNAKSDGQYQFALLNGAGTPTIILGPWRSLNWFTETTTLLTINLSDNGFLVAISGNADAKQAVWKLSPSGEVLFESIGANVSNLIMMTWYGIVECSWIQALGYYCVEDSLYSGEMAVALWDVDGNWVGYRFYDGMGVIASARVAKTKNGLYAIKTIITGADRVLEIWLISDDVGTYVASVENGTSSSFAWFAKDNEFYVSSYVAGRPLYKITEQGDVTVVVDQCQWHRVNYSALYGQWRGDA